MPAVPSCLWACLLLSAVPAAPAQEAPDRVPVRWFGQTAPQAVSVRADAGLRFYAGEGPANVLAELAPHEEATIRLRGDELYVKMEATAFFALSLRLVPNDGASFEIALVGEGVPQARRRYAGGLTLEVDRTASKGLKLVNLVAVEDYPEARLPGKPKPPVRSSRRRVGW